MGGELGPARTVPNMYAGSGPTLYENRMRARHVPRLGRSRQSAAVRALIWNGSQTSIRRDAS